MTPTYNFEDYACALHGKLQKQLKNDNLPYKDANFFECICQDLSAIELQDIMEDAFKKGQQSMVATK